MDTLPEENPQEENEEKGEEGEKEEKENKEEGEEQREDEPEPNEKPEIMGTLLVGVEEADSKSQEPIGTGMEIEPTVMTEDQE